MTRTRMLLAAALALALAEPAMAQINPFPNTNGAMMNKADLEQMYAATQRLNERNPIVVGATETWDGEVSGTVRLNRIFHAHNTICHAVTYKMRRTTTVMRTLKLNWCKAPDGSWKTDG